MPTPAEQAYLEQAESTRPQRMKWFRDARFGMFVHWGLYAQLGRHEWAMWQERIPLGEYEPLADTWKPKPRAACEWAALARKAGMKYMVMTTKHHEGFLLWDSQMSDFNAARRGPGRDLVREYVDACREAGLKVGFYYSLMDWHHPDGAACLHDEAARRRFCDYTQGCVRELCTNYGKIDILWYDVSWPLSSPEAWESYKLNAMVRSLQPQIIINNRSQLPEDIGTPEEHITAEQAGRDWEACMTFNGSWGYMPTPPEDYHSTRKVLDMIRTCAAGQGNLLLNLGPKPDGSLPQEAVERLSDVGKWLKTYGAAVYGPVDRAMAGMPGSALGAWSRKGKKLYFWCRQWPGRELAIGGLKSKVTQVRLFPDGRPLPFAQSCDPRRFFSDTNERLVIRGLPEKSPDPIAQVALLEITVRSLGELAPTGKWDSRYVKNWKVSKLHRPIADISKAAPVTDARALGWQAASADETGFVSVHDRFAGANGVAYLATRVEVARSGTWNLKLGYDGGVRLFVDGEAVFADPERRNPALPDRAVVPVALRKGQHEIVVALDTASGMGWGIFLRFQVPQTMRKKFGKPVFPMQSIQGKLRPQPR